MDTILFDLDGTLHYMDQERFTKKYFDCLSAYFAPCGYDPQQLIKGVVSGTYAMAKNDGSCTNKQAFWRAFSLVFGEEAYSKADFFEEFYIDEFNKVRDTCHPYEGAGALIKGLKAKGKKIVLATNPVFPMVAHYNRIKWAGMDKDDFDYITSYENYHYCKPNPDYYREILKVCHSAPEDCIMVGNDVTEDMAAAQAGIKVYLVTDCLLNRDNKVIDAYPHGNFAQMAEFVGKL